MKVAHGGDEYPRSDEADDACDAIDPFRPATSELQRSIPGKDVIEAEEGDDCKERPEVEDQKTQNSCGYDDTVGIDEKHACTTVETTAFRRQDRN